MRDPALSMYSIHTHTEKKSFSQLHLTKDSMDISTYFVRNSIFCFDEHITFLNKLFVTFVVVVVVVLCPLCAVNECSLNPYRNYTSQQIDSIWLYPSSMNSITICIWCLNWCFHFYFRRKQFFKTSKMNNDCVDCWLPSPLCTMTIFVVKYPNTTTKQMLNIN